MDPAIRRPSRGKDFSQALAEKGWYHSFELPDGAFIDGYMDLDWQRKRYALFPIPDDLRGKRLLDIGAWDGWFSFEAERHGAEVTAIDCVEIENFLDIRRRLSSKVDYRILDFYELPQSGLGKFDFVFFLGVLYHLKHPLLALEIVCGLATDMAIVECFVTDAETWPERRESIPTMEFYETDELGNQLDNWIGPSVGCLMAMCRAAGFARVELLHVLGSHAVVACHRKWEAVPLQTDQEPPELLTVANNRDSGVNFTTRKDEYIACWFRTRLESVARERLRLEVDGCGVPAVHARGEGNGVWKAIFGFPPGLDGGWKAVRLRFADSGFGPTLRIAVDIPLRVDCLALTVVCDGITWSREEIAARGGGMVSCWVKGLPENADRGNVGAHLGPCRLEVEYVGEADLEGCRQINAAVPGDAPRGEQRFRVECAGISSESWPLKITG